MVEKILKFKYWDVRGMYLPIIPLSIKNIEEIWWPVNAFADSGSTYAVFHKSVCDTLGYNMIEGEFEQLELGNGDLIEIFIHKIPVKIDDEVFEAYIAFSDEVDEEFGVIGTTTFFEIFTFCFNQKEKILKLIKNG